MVKLKHSLSALSHGKWTAPTLSCVKWCLKTYLFQRSFPPHGLPGYNPHYVSWLLIYTLRFVWCASESFSSEIKDMDTWCLIFGPKNHFTYINFGYMNGFVCATMLFSIIISWLLLSLTKGQNYVTFLTSKYLAWVYPKMYNYFRLYQYTDDLSFYRHLPGTDFMKGLRLSPVSDWATGLNLSLLAQLSLCLKWFSQKGSQLRPSLSNNHSGFLCHVTIFCSQNILLMAYMFLVWHIISLVKYHFAMGNLVNM